MKFLFLFFASLFLSLSSYANTLKPIPPYAGDIPFTRTIMLDEFAALRPRIQTEEDKAKLEDAKQRLKNGLINHNTFQANIKKYNGTQASSIKSYEYMLERLRDNYSNNAVKNHIYDKEFVELLDKNLRNVYHYFSDVYKEQEMDIFLKKLDYINSFRELLKNQEYIVNHL